MTDPSQINSSNLVSSVESIANNIFSSLTSSSSGYHADFLVQINEIVDYLNTEADKQQELLKLVDNLHTKVSSLKDTLNLVNQTPVVQAVETEVKTKVSWFKHLFSDFRKK